MIWGCAVALAEYCLLLVAGGVEEHRKQEEGIVFVIDGRLYG